MFLFTTPPSPTAAPAGSPTNVVDAIRQGADQTGTSFDYLLSTAKRESALNPDAKAPTSSATGLFQFIDSTWLSVVKSSGDKAGLGEYADRITARPGGRLTVEDPSDRQTILDLRRDPAVASVMAGALTQQNRDTLQAALGREPNAGELYAAHMLGARGALDLIGQASRDPSATAAGLLPEAAAANRGIFYDRSGRPRAAGEVYALMGSGAATADGSAVPTGLDAASGRRTTATGQAGYREAGLGGLFQTGARTAPVSEAVAKIWRVNHAAATGGSAAVSFFPRSRALGDVSQAEPAEEAVASTRVAALPAEGTEPLTVTVTGGVGSGVPANVPMPPPRPAALVGARTYQAQTRGARP